MSVYYVNKFLFQIDRDPELLAAYKAAPADLVERWDADLGRRLGNGDPVERTTWLHLEPEERRALVEHDYVALFEMGAHFFLCLTLFIAVYDDDYAAEQGPLSFQREYASKLSHWLGKDYPIVAL